MIGGNQILQVARSVANGDGDWGDVPRCVREAIVLALAGPDSYTAQQIDTSAAAAELLQQQQQQHQQRRYCSPWPTRGEENRLVPSLTEEIIQRSVCTFEDATWLRDQAVRSFAQFHNTVEGLREGMRHHLLALWRTALQLDPSLMSSVRERFNLHAEDEIPDGVAVRGDAQQQLLRLQTMLEELNQSVDTLRLASVRFAANMLSDDEKSAMGLDPAKLRPNDLLPYTPSRGNSMATSLQRNANAHDRGAGSGPPMFLGGNRWNSEEEQHQHQQNSCYDYHHDPQQEYRHQKEHQRESERERDGQYPIDTFIPRRCGAASEMTVREWQQRYMQRIALLNEAALNQVSNRGTSRGSKPGDVFGSRLSTEDSFVSKSENENDDR